MAREARRRRGSGQRSRAARRLPWGGAADGRRNRLGPGCRGADCATRVTPDDLASELADVLLRADPLAGSMLGLSEYDHRLPDLTEEGQVEEVAALRHVAREGARLDGDGADEDARQTADLVRHSAGARADAAAVPFVEFTVGDFHGAPVAQVLTALAKVPLDSHERAAAYLARLHRLPVLLEAAAARHVGGAAAGRLPVRRLVGAAIAQLDAFLGDPEVGGIRRAFAPDASFDEQVDRALGEEVRPALARYRETLASRLVGAARDDDRCGLCHLPDGESMYAALARVHTSTSRAVGELHRTGLDVVDRVNEEYRELGGRVWRITDLDAIMGRLRTDPDLRFGDAQEIISRARSVVARAEDAAPRWFGELPETSCLVEAVPAVEESGSAPAYYLPPALDGSRRGTYFVNTSRATERSRADAETMAFHEAVPGHHFQLAIAQRQPARSLPRRVLHDTACAEGWGLYAERLADEMGLYTDDVARLGMLTATRGERADWSSTPASTPWAGAAGRRWTGSVATCRSPTSSSRRR